VHLYSKRKLDACKDCMPEMAADHGGCNVQGPGDWLWQYYTYRVTVYCPWTQRIEVGVCSAYSL
jgi:hypothetical protein